MSYQKTTQMNTEQKSIANPLIIDGAKPKAILTALHEAGHTDITYQQVALYKHYHKERLLSGEEPISPAKKAVETRKRRKLTQKVIAPAPEYIKIKVNEMTLNIHTKVVKNVFIDPDFSVRVESRL